MYAFVEPMLDAVHAWETSRTQPEALITYLDTAIRNAGLPRNQDYLKATRIVKDLAYEHLANPGRRSLAELAAEKMYRHGYRRTPVYNQKRR